MDESKLSLNGLKWAWVIWLGAKVVLRLSFVAFVVLLLLGRKATGDAPMLITILVMLLTGILIPALSTRATIYRERSWKNRRIH